MNRSIGRTLLRIAAGAIFALWTAWNALTLVFANLNASWLRHGLALAYVACVVLVLLLVRPFRRALAFAISAGLIVTMAYVATRPSNDRDWQPDVAVSATASLEGDKVTIRGVRNFRYRSEHDFDANWEERSFDLSKLRSLDLLMSYWGPVAYCHTMLSFGFEGGEQLIASVEARKERGEEYSTFGGFFKQYELVYLFGDERDFIGLRTNQRGEDVYLYRIRVRPHRLHELFLSYVHFADRLAVEPEFYDVIENSCGVNVMHRAAESGKVVFAGRELLLNGEWDRHFYEFGMLDQSRPFEELRRLSRVNDRARAAGDAPDFSRRIREGLPPPPQFPE